MKLWTVFYSHWDGPVDQKYFLNFESADAYYTERNGYNYNSNWYLEEIETED